MSSSLWFCHQCHAEMRPLMTPHPVCASCRGSFVEKLENPDDDPRDFQSRPFPLPGAFDGFLRSNSPRPHSPPGTQDGTASSGFRFEFHTGSGPGNTRSFVFGGPNTLIGRPSQNQDRQVPAVFEFLRRESDNASRSPGDITGPLMAQYLLTLFGRESNGPDSFAGLLGVPPSARWGDYVFNQEALDQILAHLAETSTAGRPVPATEEIIDNLPREVLMQGSPLLERDCAVCKESFKLDTEDQDELIVVTLPCKHPFHETCILPWLKSSGTCPVCRHALIDQPQQHPPGPSGGSSTSNRPSPSSASRSQSPGGSRGGGSGLFYSIFGGGNSGGSSDSYPARSRHNPGRGSRSAQLEAHSRSTPPFPGHWIEDID